MLKENEKILREKFNDLYLSLSEHSENESNIHISDIKTREDINALVVEKDGKELRLNSAYRPVSEAKKWCEQFELNNYDTLVFMFGFGNGVFARELLNESPKESLIYIWEPSYDIFNYILCHFDISDILDKENLTLAIGEGSEKFLMDIAAPHISWSNLTIQVRCDHPGYVELFDKENELFWKDVNTISDAALAKMNTNAKFGKSATENILTNINFIKDSNYITEFVDKISPNVPVIVVAAGPSLDKNIEDLRLAKGRAIIVATDTALRMLEKHNIYYDCMVTYDPEKPTSYFFDCPGCKDKPMFMKMESQKDISSFHTGRKIWMSPSLFIEDLYAKHDMYFPFCDSGGSVATFGYNLAECLKVKNVILIGQDLAYDGDKTHADGFNDNRSDGSDEEYVEGIYGKKVKTRFDWMYYLKWFEKQIRLNPHLNVIDATEGGALIHGSEVLTLKEAIDKYCIEDFSFEKMMDELQPTFHKKDFAPVRKDIVRINKCMKNVIYKADAALKYVDEFIDGIDDMSDDKANSILRELRKANMFIEKQDDYDILDIYTSYLSAEDMMDVNKVTGDKKTDDLNTVKAAKVVYETYKKAADDICKMYDEYVHI